MTPPNTTPLNEEDRLGEIKKIILESGVLDEHDKNVGGDLYSSKGNQELTADALAQYIAPNITKLIQTLEKKAQLKALNAIIEQTPTGKPISRKRIRATISRLKSDLFFEGVKLSPNNTTTRSGE